MKLKEYNWDTQLDEEVEYPDAPIKAFIDFLRTNKSWQEDNAAMIYDTMVYRRYQKLQRELSESAFDDEPNGEIEISFTPEVELDDNVAPPDWDA